MWKKRSGMLAIAIAASFAVLLASSAPTEAGHRAKARRARNECCQTVSPCVQSACGCYEEVVSPVLAERKVCLYEMVAKVGNNCIWKAVVCGVSNQKITFMATCDGQIQNCPNCDATGRRSPVPVGDDPSLIKTSLMNDFYSNKEDRTPDAISKTMAIEATGYGDWELTTPTFMNVETPSGAIWHFALFTATKGADVRAFGIRLNENPQSPNCATKVTPLKGSTQPSGPIREIAIHVGSGTNEKIFHCHVGGADAWQ